MANVAYLSRQALITNNNTFIGSGADFGAQNVSGFTRITGIASDIGSMTVRMRTGLNQAGPFIVSSNWTVNSGVTYLDALNYGGWTTFDIIAVNSQVGNFAIFGDPVR